jgi:quercetin dioxygenase-like cupin family protein
VAILSATAAPRYHLHGVTIIGLAARSRGATEVTTYRVQLDPHSATPPHSHDHEEVFTVVGGSVTTVLDGEHLLTNVGDTMIVPAGAEHYVFTAARSGDLIAAIPSGTLFITPEGEKRIADWAT